jgi:hypothetical protein
MLPIMLKSYIAYADFSRKPWISLKHNDKTEKQFRRHKTPTTPRQEEPPVRSMSPGGRKNNLLSGDVLQGPRPPGKAMTEKVVASDPGPRG